MECKDCGEVHTPNHQEIAEEASLLVKGSPYELEKLIESLREYVDPRIGLIE